MDHISEEKKSENIVMALKGFLHRKLTFDILLSIKKYEKMYYTLFRV